MHFRETPNIKNFLLNLDIYNYFYKLAISVFYNLFRMSVSLTPRILFPILIIFVPVSIYGALKLKYNGKIFLLFSVVLYFVYILGVNAQTGKLANRYFMTFLSCFATMFSVGLIEIIFFFKNKFPKISKIKEIIFNKFVIFLFCFIGTSFLIVKYIGFNENVNPMFNFGYKIAKITNESDVIMYGFTPQDAWCVTKRRIVNDPLFSPLEEINIPNKAKRLKEEIDHFHVKYLWIDLSNLIYKRDSKSLFEILKDYQSLKLQLVLKDEVNRYYFYRIIK
jgi:hypothetical protein